MYNASPPPETDLPTTAQLIRATLISIVAAIAILVAVVLPAEYAIDPTGIGRALGLTEMGEIKQELEKEAKEHSALRPQNSTRDGFFETLGALLVSPAAAQTVVAQTDKPSDWKDEVTFSLDPGQGFEIKLTMKSGATASYSWSADGGRINYDLHAHANSQTARYEKGRGKREATGAFTAKFDGNHGWFFRNRDRKPVRVVLKLKGRYSAIVRK